MSILFGLLLARRFYCRSALSLSPGRTGGLLPRINAPNKMPEERFLRTQELLISLFFVSSTDKSRFNIACNRQPEHMYQLLA